MTVRRRARLQRVGARRARTPRQVAMLRQAVSRPAARRDSASPWGRCTVAGSRSSPSGLTDNPAAGRGDAEVAVLPDDPLRPRVDHDDAVVPVVGDRDHPVRPAHRERRAVERARPRRRAVRPDDRPRGVIIVDAAGRVEAGDEDVAVRGAAARPTGTSSACARRRRDDRGASRRSTQPPISVTSMPPSGSGVAPFGDESERGGSCAQTPAPPISRDDPLCRADRSTRQFLMSATVIGRCGSRYASSGFERSPRGRAGDTGAAVTPDEPVACGGRSAQACR